MHNVCSQRCAVVYNRGRQCVVNAKGQHNRGKRLCNVWGTGNVRVLQMGHVWWCGVVRRRQMGTVGTRGCLL